MNENRMYERNRIIWIKNNERIRMYKKNEREKLIKNRKE